jgi:DNA polymerase III alpha subunit
MQVKGLRVETIVAMVRAREAEGAFRSLEDFLARVAAERDEIEALIKCGAFDEVCGMTRAAMLWQWNLLQVKGKAVPRGLKPIGGGESMSELKLRSPGEEAEETQEHGPFAEIAQGKQESSRENRWKSALQIRGSEGRSKDRPLQEAGVLFAEMETEDEIGAALREIEAPDYTREQKLRYEREILEVCVSGHPLDFLPRNGETWSDELPGLHGKRVTLCGWVVTYRHVGTKNYRNMMFVTLEDQRGLFEVILFPDVYDKYGGLVYETRSMRVTGMVMEGEHINGERMERLEQR